MRCREHLAAAFLRFSLWHMFQPLSMVVLHLVSRLVLTGCQNDLFGQYSMAPSVASWYAVAPLCSLLHVAATAITLFLPLASWMVFRGSSACPSARAAVPPPWFARALVWLSCLHKTDHKIELASLVIHQPFPAS